MSNVDVMETEEGALKAISKTWGVLLFLGLLSIVIGIVIMAWPGKTVVVVAVILAVWLVVSGIFEIVRGFGRGQGQGVFYDLGAMDLGDRVRVRDDAGTSLEFEVVARESLSKKGLPYDELFAADGPPRLTLISCGGEYDADRGGYQDNVIVTAVPVPRGA